MRLISYYETPAVCALEYDEQRDLRQHPDKTDFYAKLIEQRTQHKKKKTKTKTKTKTNE